MPNKSENPYSVETPSSYSGRYRFEGFTLDVENRQLFHTTTPLTTNAKYFDALVLLVTHSGKLISKDEFFETVWNGVVVSEHALTQCIKDLRKLLDDTASRPRFIKTVPKHGYMFIAPVTHVMDAETAVQEQENPLKPIRLAMQSGDTVAVRDDVIRFGFRLAGGILGGLAAGLAGGIIYGTGLSSMPYTAQPGAFSILTVLVTVNALLGVLGATGISTGISTARFFTDRPSVVLAAGLAGGAFVGGFSRLFGLDAFRLFFGFSPEGITGAYEGAILGIAVALGVVVSGVFSRSDSLLKTVLIPSLIALAAGVIIAITGGNLLGGSLERLAYALTTSQVQADALARFFGDLRVGTLSRILLTGFEAMIFGAGMAFGFRSAERTYDVFSPSRVNYQ